MDKPFQRIGSKSNTFVGNAFENTVQQFFLTQGLPLQKGISVKVGINGKKAHKFDLGNPGEKVLVECKSHTWTQGENVPSAKMTAWDQAMFYFLAAPRGYRKIFVVLKAYSKKRQETLAEYYVRTKAHLIPQDVEIWEFDEGDGTGYRIK